MGERGRREREQALVERTAVREEQGDGDEGEQQEQEQEERASERERERELWDRAMGERAQTCIAA
eukprot:3827497-Rhodomonas_salina.1